MVAAAPRGVFKSDPYPVNAPVLDCNKHHLDMNNLSLIMTAHFPCEGLDEVYKNVAKLSVHPSTLDGAESLHQFSYNRVSFPGIVDFIQKLNELFIRGKRIIRQVS